MEMRVERLKEIIRQQRNLGLAPAELHMNAETIRDFSKDIAASNPDHRSVLERMRGVQPVVKRVEFFEGLRVVENPNLHGALIIARPVQAMDDPHWLEKLFDRSRQPILPKDGSTPWHQSAAEAQEVPSASPDAAVTTEALFRDSGITPTTVLLKAMENTDKVDDVVILRFIKGGSIDMCSTMNRYAVIGALQAALGYVMNGGD